MSNTYSFDTIARTSGTAGGLTGFDNTPSINDFGLVSFVGKLNGSEELFVGDALNPITNLSTSPSFNGSFLSGIEINNDNQVVAVNSGAIRLWDADNPGLPRKTIGTAIFGNEFTQFDYIYPFASINNTKPSPSEESEESEVVFNADPKGNGSKVGLHTYKSFSGENTYFEGALANSIGLPMLADNGRVVSKDNNSTINVFNYGLNQSQIIANDATVGRAPGISDNGKAVAFYGDNGGEGIFISVETDSGWERHRIAGVAGNGELDPGETYEDSNSNGEFDSGEEDLGLIGSFSEFERIGINYSETEDGGLGTVTYLAKDESGNESLISSQFNISSSQVDVSHSLVAKVGDPANEVDTGLTGNIQDLNIYDPINDPGQIAFWTKTTTGKEAVVRANPIRKPVFIVPGILGSFPNNSDIGEWVTDRGFDPERLELQKLNNSYDDLVETFKRAGYQEGVDLFVATYDWRLDPAPIDGTIDGVIERSVEDLTDDTHEYSMDQFAFWLQKSIEGWQSQFTDGEPIPDLESVDVIAHSAGGATVRSYIQSDAYGAVFDNAGTKLPEINNFVTLGVPYRGASKTWNSLNDNFSGGTIPFFAQMIAQAGYAKVKNEKTIKFNGSDSATEAITPQEAASMSSEEFVEAYVPHLRSLLATNPFIKDSSGTFKTAEEVDPQQRNELLLDLNDGFDSINNEGGQDPTKFVEKIDGKLTVVYGSGNDKASYSVLEKTGPDFEPVLDPSNPTPGTPVYVPISNIPTLSRGKIAPEADEIWYENIVTGDDGDATVSVESATGIFEDLDNVPEARKNKILVKNKPTANHTEQPNSLVTQKFILETLGVNLKDELISTDLYSPPITATGVSTLGNIFANGKFILDPVEGFLVDAQGRRLGYTSSTGIVTEIPNSEWIGEADGFGYIQSSLEGEFHLELTGLGEDYYVLAELETEDGLAYIEAEGFLADGEQLTLDVPLLPEVSLVPEPRTNAGSNDIYTDSLGLVWSANDGFSGGRNYANTNAIAQTDDDLLYQSEYLGENFFYSQDVPNWSYDVTLHFAEIYFNDAGRRVFDVSAEDQLILDNFDIIDEAGGKNIALEKTFTVEVNDGTLDLDFLAEVNNAKISAVEIKPAGTPIRVNGGEENYTDSLGKEWLSNDGLSGGRNSSRNNAIAQTDNDPLYQTEYYGQDFDYSQSVANGNYDVTLHFAETVFYQPGKRVFDVSAEDQLILDNFDIIDEAGGQDIAIEKTFTVGVNDGNLDLDFLAEVNNAKISAIEIKPDYTIARVNAGKDAYTDSLGIEWLSNDGLSGGRNSSRDNAIAQTDDDPLYQSEYYGEDFDYSQSVANGNYDVTLHFAETVFYQPGQRVFDVSAEDQLILDNFDIISEASGKNIAIERTFTVGVDDGTLELDFLAEVNNAKISAIEIKPTII